MRHSEQARSPARPQGGMSGQLRGPQVSNTRLWSFSSTQQAAWALLVLLIPALLLGPVVWRWAAGSGALGITLPMARSAASSSTDGPPDPLVDGTTLFVLHTTVDGYTSPVVQAAYQHMQYDLGPENVFLLVDDTKASWEDHWVGGTPAVRLSEPRPRGSDVPHVLLVNKHEGAALLPEGEMRDNLLSGKNWTLSYWGAPSIFRRQPTIVCSRSCLRSLLLRQLCPPPPSRQPLVPRSLRPHHATPALPGPPAAENPTFVLLGQHFDTQLGWNFIYHIEDDMYCNGNYRACLAGTHTLPHDFLCTERIHGSAYRWSMLRGEVAQRTTDDERIACYVMAKRFSRKALRLVSDVFPRSYG